MKKSLVKVPLGPEFALYDGEFYAVTRHRIMLFFYFGLICVILVASMGRDRQLSKPELIIGIAAIEVVIGLTVVVLCKSVAAWWAARRKQVPRIHLGWVLVLTVTSAVASGEVLEPILLGAPNGTTLELAMKLVFYVTITELLCSIVLQYTLGYILADVRKGRAIPADVSTGISPDESRV